ncbi:DNA/RNA-binding protein KIN17 [Onthophagus taurus]|uniref:DNA/RNA-binding protein KIN17 n=1 Tax=Onthophagus taurus TaxID=166361 RepID=UPI000C20F00D|nr:DNA/RNA-binding protein KIN17 [Onthophagus taurus]
MPRAEVGTPKYLANKMKAKGLQKLRWYCQMCQKQCRDENGFKCHTMSESHQRQLLLFADNPKKYMDEFSYDFAKGYLDILRRQFGTKRVLANKVYQEYITDKNHIHMNSTRWVTLTGFVKWCAATGKCISEDTEKGWYITYIDRDPETIAREKRKHKKLKMDKDDEEKTMEFIENQVKRGQEKIKNDEPIFTELKREEEEKLTLEIKLENKFKVPAPIPVSKLIKVQDDDTKSIKSFKSTKSEGRKRSALDDIMDNEEKKKEKSNRKDYWITEGIVVKIVTKSLGEDYYKQKGVVVQVQDKYVAIVKLLEGGKKVKLDQEHLETVIPAIGKLVRVVNGAYRGEKATLLKLDERNFCVDVEIASGLLQGRKISGVQYEDVSKIHCD